MNQKSSPVTSRDNSNSRHTLSGARVRKITGEAAQAFLYRLSATKVPPIRFALGATDDESGLLGVLAVTGLPNGVATIHIAVNPERRRLQMATDLMETFAVDRPRWIGSRFRVCESISPDVAARLAAKLDSYEREPRAPHSGGQGVGEGTG